MYPSSIQRMKQVYFAMALLCASLSVCGQSTPADTIVNRLQEVVVSGNRTVQKRIELPIAIANISSRTIQETKAQRLDFLLNQVSGVNMINLGNEQHEMSIRQPMSTNNLFCTWKMGSRSGLRRSST